MLRWLKTKKANCLDAFAENQPQFKDALLKSEKSAFM